MWSIKKNISSLSLSLLIVASFLAQASAEKIGILTFSEEARYLEAIKGFKDNLQKAGIKEPRVKFTLENAGASKARAVELAQKLAAEKPDLIFTLGTSATVIAAREIKDVPIVFSTVYDPVEAGIAKDWRSSGNNTTGTSPLVPMSKLLDSLTAFASVKRLAVLYTPGEKNSEAQFKNLQKIQADYNIKIIPVILSTKEEVVQVLPEILRTIDALYVTGSNVVDSQVATIVDLATKSKVATITHLEDLVEKGVLLGVCADSYLVGHLAGEKAIRILKGAKPAAIPIETIKKFDVMLNVKTAKQGRFYITPEFTKMITRTVE
ncbi:MAG: ABC transporter substrate-binding protein [Deltaproteobacteria bacterium]|nr:ABC transporter substrate-binding protein [Deltaproteobacteria bacterium]